MGRGRGKGKKQSGRDDAGSGEDEKLPVRRRGRPLKPMKDEMEEEDEVEKVEEDDEEDSEETKLSKSSKNQENGRKRKKPSQIKEGADLVTDESAVGAKANATVLIKTVGYRQNGSRRKNKPRRAAEVGVECK